MISSKPVIPGAALVGGDGQKLVDSAGGDAGLSAIIPGDGPVVAPTCTLFGGFIRLLSFGAAEPTLISLQKSKSKMRKRV